MYFQFLIEDESTEVLIHHVMEKLKENYREKEIYYDSKSFHGLGHLKRTGGLQERKTGNLLNDLRMYLRAFDRKLSGMKNTSIVVVLDNDMNETKIFREKLEKLAIENMIFTDHVFCIAVKEMEAWLLGDMNAIEAAYPKVRKNAIKNYTQDEIGDTWEVLANAVYKSGLSGLRKKAGNAYTEIGKAKKEWADRIGIFMDLENNRSPSFQYFITSLKDRIEKSSQYG